MVRQVSCLDLPYPLVVLDEPRAEGSGTRAMRRTGSHASRDPRHDRASEIHMVSPEFGIGFEF
jgi:hypothetical protein